MLYKLFLNQFKNAWLYRSFILGSVKRDFQSKYRNSILGIAWTILNPLSLIIIYTVIFSQNMKSKLPEIDSSYGYSIYICIGIITWGLFNEIISNGQSVFIDNANLIKKINFPRICLPIITILSASLNFIIIFSLFIIFLIISNNFPGWLSIFIVPIILIQIFFAIGLGISLGVLNVFFRDAGKFFTIVLQFWFWLTPIVYPPSILPEATRAIILNYNPISPIIVSYQTIFVSQQLPNWHTLLMPLVIAILLCIIGLRLFLKHSGEMVDEL